MMRQLSAWVQDFKGLDAFKMWSGWKNMAEYIGATKKCQANIEGHCHKITCVDHHLLSWS